MRSYMIKKFLIAQACKGVLALSGILALWVILAIPAASEEVYFYIPQGEVIVNSYGVIDEDRNLVDVGIYTRDFIQQANYKYMMQLYDIDPDNIQLKMIPNVNVDTLIIDRRPD